MFEVVGVPVAMLDLLSLPAIEGHPGRIPGVGG